MGPSTPHCVWMLLLVIAALNEPALHRSCCCSSSRFGAGSGLGISCITAQVSVLPLLQPPLSYTAPELAGNGMQRADITLTSSADVFSLGEACLFRLACRM